MLRIIQSLLFWGFLTLTSIALFPVAVVVWLVSLPFDPRLRALHLFTCFWASLYTWANPAWPVSIVHRERLVSDRTCVYIANHLSLVDILVMFRLFTHFKWVSKLENFRVPVIGWNMRMNGYVPLRRGDRASVVRMMEQCDAALAAGNPIMMFPEGTRSTTGEMRPFKPGAFELAIRNNVPIQPLLIRGTSDALPKRGFVLQGRHPISITVLDAIPPSEFAGNDAVALSERVRDLMASEIRKPEREHQPAGIRAADALN
jgi:1-acyl-sn-glycerol-3-phosphate acyltransferase